VRLLLVILVLVAAGAAAAVAVHTAMPAPYARLWYPLRYEAIVTGHARNYRLDPALVASVIYHESRFRADARSGAGAIGLMQLQPQTAQGIALRTGGTRFELSDLYDPEINIRYGCWYLRHLLDKYDDERYALAAYNAGQSNVDRWLQEGRGIVFTETREYVDNVLETQEIYRRAYPDVLGAAARG
jgi:soluble lytic murein transglycosylase